MNVNGARSLLGHTVYQKLKKLHIEIPIANSKQKQKALAIQKKA